MSYRTKAAHDLVDSFQTQSAMFTARAMRAEDPYKRGLDHGYAAAFNLAAEWATKQLAQVESESALVPEFGEADIHATANAIVAAYFDDAA
jgi:hypothetical protein